MRVVGRSAGGAESDLVLRFSVAVPDVPAISSSLTIDSTNTTYDGRTVVITGGTVTIRGAHTLDRLMVLGGTIVAPAGEKLDLTTTRGLYAGCGAAFDLSGRGDPGFGNVGNNSGGSHVGLGGTSGASAAATFGSVYRPAERGAGGRTSTGGTVGGAGGGVIAISGGAVVVDGTVRANGAASPHGRGGGGGGSIWIRAARVSGAGKIEANGGSSSSYSSGGGGAIAIETTGPGGTLPALSATSASSPGQRGGPGSIYLHGPASTWGDLRIDNGDFDGAPADLPSLDSGQVLAVSGSTITTDRSADVPGWFAGHWVEIRDAANTLRGTWRVASATGRTITLEGDDIAVAAGDLWQGVYRFDSLTLRRVTFLSSDPVRVAGTETIEASVVTRSITAGALVITGAATLSHATGDVLNIDVEGELRVEAGGAIDVSGRGEPGFGNVGNNSGGSHIGSGGGALGTTFGSIRRPAERGGGGRTGTNSTVGGAGGGVIGIRAGSVVIDGTIRANGSASPNGRGGGAGGSILIGAARVSGAGRIEANGGSSSSYSSGGGGAIAVEYTDPSSALPVTSAKSAAANNSFGGAGSVFTAGPGPAYGDVLVDNTGFALASSQPTVFPSLGYGVVAGVSGNAVTTDRTSIPGWFAGHWVDVLAPDGTRRGTWRIASADGGSFTLEGSPEVVTGDTWRGVYLLDSVRLRNAKVVSLDDVRGARDLDATSSLVVNEPPAFDPARRSQITVVSDPVADAVVGPAGAVSDPTPPIVLTASNVRTGQTYSANASGDGSFRVPVLGQAGDTFTLWARDSYSVPATSAAIPVGGSVAWNNSVASVSLWPATVTGGNAADGAVRLQFPVRSGMGEVSLTSSSSAVIVPAAVLIPDGASSAHFPVTTAAVEDGSEVTITATSNGTSASAVLTLLATSSALSQFELAPSSIAGGTSVNATVTLGGPAPAGGARVWLESFDTRLAEVPDFVDVAEGAASATLTIRTFGVSADSSVVLQATRGSTLQRTLSLTACAGAGFADPPDAIEVETMWVDESLPSGAVQTGDGTIDTTQAASGAASIHLASAAPGERMLAFTGAAALQVAPEDVLVLHALVDPCDPPRQLLVGWKSGASEFRTSWGESRIEPTTAHVRPGALPRGGEWARLEVLARAIGITSVRSLDGLSIRADGGQVWIDAIGRGACALGTAPSPPADPFESVWFDDQLPEGAVAEPAGGIVSAWTWDESQSAGGTRSHREPLRTGLHEHYFEGSAPLKVGQGDVLFAWVLLDPCNPPDMVDLTFKADDATQWEHKAFWGEDRMPWGTLGTASRYPMGPLPELGKWVRLEVPAALLGLEGSTISGAAFVLNDGQAWFDRSGRVARVNVALGKTAAQSSYLAGRGPGDEQLVVNGELFEVNYTGSQAGPWWQVDLGAVQPIDAIHIYNRSDAQQAKLSNYWVWVSDVPFTSTTAAVTRFQPGISGYWQLAQAGRPTVVQIGRTGRYVRIQISGTTNLHMAEVQVWAPSSPARRNIGGGQIPSQSSTSGGQEAEAAVNGVLDWSLTTSSAQPWWQVDLGSVQPIGTVDIGNGFAAATAARMSNFYLFVSDVPFDSTSPAATLSQAGVGAYYHGTPARTSYSFPVNRTGRYLRLQLTGTNFLHPTEVRVWAHDETVRALRRATESPPPR